MAVEDETMLVVIDVAGGAEDEIIAVAVLWIVAAEEVAVGIMEDALAIAEEGVLRTAAIVDEGTSDALTAADEGAAETIEPAADWADASLWADAAAERGMIGIGR